MDMDVCNSRGHSIGRDSGIGIVSVLRSPRQRGMRRLNELSAMSLPTFKSIWSPELI